MDETQPSRANETQPFATSTIESHGANDGQSPPKKQRQLPAALFWIIAIAAPVTTAAIAAMQFPAGTEVPLHWNSAGEIDRYGSPWAIAAVMVFASICNGLLALCYRFNDFLYDHGFVHGVRSKKSARIWYCGIAAFCTLLTVGIVLYAFQKAA